MKLKIVTRYLCKRGKSNYFTVRHAEQELQKGVSVVKKFMSRLKQKKALTTKDIYDNILYRGNITMTIINTGIIRTKRIEKKLPQRKLGAMLDLDQSAISNIEHGKKELRLSEAARLAEFLEFNISDLVRKR